MKKELLIGIAVILLLMLAGALIALYKLPLSLGGKGVPRPEALPDDTLLSAEQVDADRQQLIGYVESVHPFFVDGSDQTPYLAAKESYLAETESAMTVRAFMEVSSRYLTVFGDGHTRLGWQYGDEVYIRHSYRNGAMHFADDSGVTDLTVTAVDQVPMAQILATIDSLFPAENEMAVAKNYDYYFTSGNLLKAAGVDVEKDVFTVTLSDGSTRECRWYVPAEEAQASDEPWGNKARRDGDIFVVEFVECVDDENLKAIAKELKEAVANGCTKVIIDARGNGGGSSNACERLLNAMGMKAPSYGMLVRFSPEAKVQKGYLRSGGSLVMKPDPSAKQNPDVELVVLCDRYTYSSATMLCVYVRDGGLGTLVGEASANMPNHYGDITFVALENSHLYASVSHKRFLRPSGETESRIVMPDVVTTSREAYQAAVELLGGE
ncbi:MAG: hypothetical protein E7320_03135 [Clostridiales bacterium]|nr:hypothetical protein [Clostridiales bacterium]